MCTEWPEGEEDKGNEKDSKGIGRNMRECVKTREHERERPMKRNLVIKYEPRRRKVDGHTSKENIWSRQLSTVDIHHLVEVCVAVNSPPSKIKGMRRMKAMLTVLYITDLGYEEWKRSINKEHWEITKVLYSRQTPADPAGTLNHHKGKESTRNQTY